jgi:hypothetical protein
LLPVLARLWLDLLLENGCIQMRPLSFRIFAWIAVAALGFITASNMVADAIKSSLSLSAAKLSTVSGASNIGRSCLASAISVERTDLKTDCALAQASQALTDLSRDEFDKPAQATLIETLLQAPHDSRLWLALALLQAKDNRPNGGALKMSYLTGPQNLALVRRRLASVAASSSLADGDLRELAAGDVRFILIRHPELKEAILEAYRQASPVGKSFIEQSTGKLDSQFSASLASSK